MFDLQVAAKEFQDALSLVSPLVGVRYDEEPDPRSDLERKMAACEAIDAVRRENIVVSLSKDTCNCIGGQYYLGLAPIPQEQIIKVNKDVHKMFASEALAKQFLNNVPPSSGRGSYVILAPLTEVSQPPDIVLFLGNAEQVNKAISFLMYSGLKPFVYNLVGAGCTSLSNPVVTGEVDINFITDHARRRVPNFASDEIILAMPFEKFKEAVSNISDAGAGKKG